MGTDFCKSISSNTQSPGRKSVYTGPSSAKLHLHALYHSTNCHLKLSQITHSISSVCYGLVATSQFPLKSLRARKGFDQLSSIHT